MKNLLNFTAVITQDEDGMFVATCPAIPGCHSQGETYEEAQKNIEEVIKLCLNVAKKDRAYRFDELGEEDVKRYKTSNYKSQVIVFVYGCKTCLRIGTFPALRSFSCLF